MTATDPPDPFTSETIASVADGRDVDADDLSALVADHQALMTRLPGVENLLYEWRKQFDATVLDRSDGWYVVDAPDWVWDEFAAPLEVTDAELDALAAAHERVAVERTTDGPTPDDATPTPDDATSTPDDATPALDDATPIVLVRDDGRE